MPNINGTHTSADAAESVAVPALVGLKMTVGVEISAVSIARVPGGKKFVIWSGGFALDFRAYLQKTRNGFDAVVVCPCDGWFLSVSSRGWG